MCGWGGTQLHSPPLILDWVLPRPLDHTSLLIKETTVLSGAQGVIIMFTEFNLCFAPKAGFAIDVDGNTTMTPAQRDYLVNFLSNLKLDSGYFGIPEKEPIPVHFRDYDKFNENLYNSLVDAITKTEDQSFNPKEEF